MTNNYLVGVQASKPLLFALPNRFAALCATIFMPKGSDTNHADDRVNAALSLQQMAKEMDALQPSLAAELRAFASRS